MQTTISSRGQIVLPAALRQRDKIRPGEQFEVERIGAGQYLLKKVPKSGSPGLVAWLRACPERGWFRPIESESTDEI